MAQQTGSIETVTLKKEGGLALSHKLKMPATLEVSLLLCETQKTC